MEYTDRIITFIPDKGCGLWCAYYDKKGDQPLFTNCIGWIVRERRWDSGESENGILPAVFDWEVEMVGIAEDSPHFYAILNSTHLTTTDLESYKESWKVQEERKLKEAARTQKSLARVPGIEFYKEDSVSVKAS